MKIHPSITQERVIGTPFKRQQFTLDNPGFCLACGDEAMECEPDVREYECTSCGEPHVYGAAEIEKTLFGVVRRTRHYENDFTLTDELFPLAELAHAAALKIKRSTDSHDKANPVVRVAKFQLTEVPL